MGGKRGQAIPGGIAMTEKEYEKMVGELSPKSPMGKDCLNAFWIGGLICLLTERFLMLLQRTKECW